MRSLVALLVGILATVALGVWFVHSMVPPEKVAEIEQAKGGTPLWPLAFVAWGVVLIRRPVWLSVLLFCVVGFVGGLLVVMGGLFGSWERHLGGGSGAQHGFVVGIVMLAACAFMLFRSIANEYRGGRE